MIASTIERVPEHTADHVNDAIRRRTELSIAECAYGDAGAIERRLDELAREWDIERAIEANAATVALVGLALGATVDRRLFALPALVAGFLLQHAVQGWCPPVPILRRLGFRTQHEIEQERYALKALRGDFETVHDGVERGSTPVAEAIDAVRL